MNFHCFSPENLSLLYLSPYVRITCKPGAAHFFQSMFRRSLRLDGDDKVLTELIIRLEKGADQQELTAWGEQYFPDFAAWLSRAMLAGVIE